MVDRYRVLIGGAGPVGSTLSLLLVERGFAPDSIVLTDGRHALDAEQDPRFIAISDASRRMLQSLDAWPDASSTPIRQIHVSHRGGFGRTLIDRDDYALDALGHVVPYGELVGALHRRLLARGLTLHQGARVSATETHADRVATTLETGACFVSDYAVHAEGGLFDRQDLRPIRRDYRQSAVCAFVTCGHPRDGIAWERFTSEGPIALLPARSMEQQGLSLIWCCSPAQAVRRTALDDAQFLTELHRSFGDRLGQFLSVGKRSTFPLGLNAVQRVSRPREFIIGNAAQTLHPVAGQGLNLGLRDAACLAGVLAEHFCAPLVCMRRFEDTRRRDRAATLGMTDFLPRIFASSVTPAVYLRGLALFALDLVPAARHALARQMMNGQR